MDKVRPATVDDVVGLNALTCRSILHWGYEPGFLDWEPEAITVTGQSVADDHIYVLEKSGIMIGYYGLRGPVVDSSLDKLFLEPALIGIGLGRILWNHAIATAAELGAVTLTFYADPNAAGFSRAMHAQWVREQTTTRPGWNLQVFRFELTPESRG